QPTRSWRLSTGSATCAQGTSGRAFAACRRSTWSIATCRLDTQTHGQEDTISESQWEQTVEDFEISRETELIEYEIGDHVVYPHHGAGKVLKKEKKEVLGEKRE